MQTCPGPNEYSPVHQTSGKGIVILSSPKMINKSDDSINPSPGPGSYTISEFRNTGLAKSILGGATRDTMLATDIDQDPGPGAYFRNDTQNPTLAHI